MVLSTRPPSHRDKAGRGPADPARIDINIPSDVDYWSRKWAISPERLKRVVDEVGVSPEDVGRRLGRMKTLSA